MKINEKIKDVEPSDVRTLNNMMSDLNSLTSDTLDMVDSLKSYLFAESLTDRENPSPNCFMDDLALHIDMMSKLRLELQHICDRLCR